MQARSRKTGRCAHLDVTISSLQRVRTLIDIGSNEHLALPSGAPAEWRVTEFSATVSTPPPSRCATGITCSAPTATLLQCHVPSGMSSWSTLMMYVLMLHAANVLTDKQSS